MMVERKLDGTLDKSSADENPTRLWKVWRVPVPSGTGSYSRLAVWQTKFGQGLKF